MAVDTLVEKIIPYKKYDININGNNFKEGVYLGCFKKDKKYVHRLLVRSGKEDIRDVEGVPRIYKFGDVNLENGVLFLESIFLIKKLSSVESSYCEGVLRRNNI